MIFGAITTNPFEALPVGAVLKLQTLVFPPLVGPSPPWTHFDGTLLQLCFKDAKSVRITGSAVMVAPAVAVAAKHVVEPEMEMLLQGSVAGYALAVAPWGLDIWQPDRITTLHNTDLVLMTLRRASALPADNTLRHVKVSTQAPDVGSPIMIVGFRASQASFSVDPPVFEGQIRAGIGLVTARYPQGRDAVMVPWPSIEVGVDTIGGMSGGPAFDRHGHFVGVLSSGMTSPDGHGPSYVSIIHPVLDQAFHAPFINQTASLRDVAQRIGSLFAP